MALDPILLPLCLFVAVLALASNEGVFWRAKAILVIGAAAALVAAAPERAGGIVGVLTLVLLVVPMLAVRLANWLTVAQKFGLAWPVCALLWLTHPERLWIAQIRTLRGLVWAARGQTARALAALQAVADDSRAPATRALIARMHIARLTHAWGSFLDESDWPREEPATVALLRMRGLAATGRVRDLVALQDAEADRLFSMLRAAPAAGAMGLLPLLSACGRTAALRRLLDGPLRALPADARAFSLAVAGMAAGGDAAAPAAETLRRLVAGPNRDIAAQARWELENPRASVVLDDDQRAVVARAEQALDAVRAARPPMFRAARATWVLVALNAVAFVLEWWRQSSDDIDQLMRLGALWPPAVLLEGEWWRVVSACFLHLGWVHFSINMVSLVLIGAATERLFGWWRMFSVYAVAGVGANVVIVGMTAADWMPPDVVVGASGAIMGLFGGLIAAAARRWWRVRGRAALLRMLWLLGVAAVQSALDVATPEISFAGHAGGLILGFFVGLALGGTAATALTSPAGFAATRGGMRRLDRRRLVLVAGGGAVALATGVLFPRRYEDAMRRRFLREESESD